MEFLTTLCDVLDTAGFEVMSDGQWSAACDSDFSFVMPVEVDWAKLDGELLPHLLDAREGLRSRTATAFQGRILVFHRGVSQAIADHLHLQSKIDLLLSWLIVGPSRRAWSALKRIVGLPSAGAGAGAGAGGDKDSGAPNGGSRKFGGGAPGGAGALAVRRTLTDALPTLGSLLKSMHKHVRLLEPTFKEVVVVYRDATTAPAPAPAGAVAGAPAPAPAVLGAESPYPSPIHIRRFVDIPMADAELVFPHTKVQAAAQDLVTVAVMVVVYFATCFRPFVACDVRDGKKQNANEKIFMWSGIA